jgi:RHS repeat-associated protein
MAEGTERNLNYRALHRSRCGPGLVDCRANADYPYDGLAAAGNLLYDALGYAYQYDAESKIKSGADANYIYDPEGNRVEKSGSTVVDTIYFGGRPIAQFSGGTWKDLIYGPNGLLAEVPGAKDGEVTYRMTDHLGSLVGTLSSAGDLLSTQDIAPFGELFTGGSTDSFVFTGKERDAESGNDYFGARYYSSSMGRFMSPDRLAGCGKTHALYQGPTSVGP